MKTTKLDVVNRQVAEKLIQVVRSGDFGGWVKDWYLNYPYTLASGRHYRGGNQMFLSEAVQGKTPVYGTFHWFSSKGYKLRKGSKATHSFYPCSGTFEKINPETKKVEIKSFFKYKLFQVFSIDDLDITEEEKQVLLKQADYQHSDNTEIIDQSVIDNMLKIVNCGYKHTGDPCYYPGVNLVQCPKITQFETSEGYYGAMFHELSHATMKELGRYKEKSSDNSTAEYAFEELVAELSAAMLCSHFGIEKDTKKTASYLASWEKHLDGKKIFSAVSKAMDAANMLLGKMEDKKDE